MKTIFLILCLFIHAIPAFSDVQTEMYAVELTDGTVAIVNYVPGSNDTLERVIRDLGYAGRPIKRIVQADLPSRLDRNFWKLNDVPIGPKVVVDNLKKQSFLNLQDDRRRRRLSAMQRLGVSPDDLKVLLSDA